MIIIHVDFKRLVRTNPEPTLQDYSGGRGGSICIQEVLSITVYMDPRALLLVVASRARTGLDWTHENNKESRETRLDYG